MARKRRTTDRRSRPLPARRARGGGAQEPSSTAAAAADHLSSLPDELLLAIVRRLSVREAVRMCTLSRRWRCLPSLLPIIDFLNLSKDKEAECDWFGAVNKAMSGRWGLVRTCEFFSRSLAPEDGRWAEAIGSTGVRALELEAIFGDDRVSDVYPVLHHCRSLTDLSLSYCGLTGDSIAARSLNVRCAGLTEFRLCSVEISDDLLGHLISTCSRLERLYIWDCNRLGSIRIRAAPCLQYLELGFSDVLDFNEARCITFEVDAPNLRCLDVDVAPWWFEEISIHAPQLTSLRIVNEDEAELPQGCRMVAEGLRGLMNNATKLRYLKLRGISTQCLSLDAVPESFHPSFVSLRTLWMDVFPQDHQQASCLTLLLQGCNRLQELHLTMGEHGSCHYGAPFHPVLLFWDHLKLLEKMPCLRRHLQEVTLSCLTGEIYEMELACFFLKEAGMLKELTLVFCKEHRGAMDIAAKHLPDLTKRSSEAKLVIGVI